MLLTKMTMEIIFWLFLLSAWFFYILPDGLLKKTLLLVTPVFIFLTGIWTTELTAVFSGAILGLSHGRYFMKRYGPKRMTRILKRTWMLLLLTTSLFYVIYWLLAVKPGWLLSMVALVWILLGLKALAMSFSRALSSRYKPDQHNKLTAKQLPTVTLAIPARNETSVLTDCLRSAVSSNYPKLEIIVLDDCSQDSTPQIIKSFAHDGVRFISGEIPATGWIGKNQAYETLLAQASGELIVFAGVDVRFRPDSIERLVNEFISKDKKMLSVMPYRSHFDLLPSLTRTLRYYWQLAFASMPVMNSVWAVDRQWLKSVGGFEPFKHAILPERELARLANEQDSYGFLLSNRSLGINSRKRASSQFETATRTLYPQYAKDPVIAVIWSSLWLGGFGLWTLSWFVSIPVLAYGAAALLLSYLITESFLQPGGWVLSGLMFPLAMLSQGILAIVSMVGFEFGRVDWKGRNVCLPAMNQLARGATYPPKNRR